MREPVNLKIGAERLARAGRIRKRIEDEIAGLEVCGRTLLGAEPMLRGSVYETRGKCGKAACHCRTGEAHRMTFVTWRTAEGRKTRSVSSEEREALSRPAAAHRRFRKAQAERGRRARAVAELIGELEDALALEIAPARDDGAARR